MFPHLDAARAAGWQIDIACQPTIFREDLAHHADRVYEVPLRRFPLHPMNGIALLQLQDIIRQGNYSLIHCHNPTGGFIGRLAATLTKTRAKRVYTAHGFHFHRHGDPLSNAVYRTAETIAGRYWSDAVLTITQEDYDAALYGGVVPPRRLFLTGGVGVSAREDFKPALFAPEPVAEFRREIGATVNTPVISMVGEFIPRKRHQDALKVFARVHSRYPNALLLLVGDGALLGTLQADATTLGIAERVRFLGFRRDIPAILAASTVFLFPSKQEGLPCAIQEALSMGIPVVATDVRGNRDLVDDSCGRLAPLGDISAQADAVCAILSLPYAAQHQMGRAGRDKMVTRYDRIACVHQWQEIYHRLLFAGNDET
jgi:glycosyltransferase involved in cell wall biosynthesis